MITYTNLTRRPEAARSLIGMTLPAFDALYAEFEVAYEERLATLTHTRRTRQPRQRTVGAGRRYTYNLRDRLLMTLFWLRVYTTYAVMGFLFELHPTNVEDNIKDVLATLAGMTSFTYERPAAERGKFGSPLGAAAAVMEAFPDVCLVIDAKEQRVQRPKSGRDDQGQPPPEAVLLGQEENTHAQESGGGAAGWAGPRGRPSRIGQCARRRHA
jgi:hypothetical protein